MKKTSCFQQKHGGGYAVAISHRPCSSRINKCVTSRASRTYAISCVAAADIKQQQICGDVRSGPWYPFWDMMYNSAMHHDESAMFYCHRYMEAIAREHWEVTLKAEFQFKVTGLSNVLFMEFRYMLIALIRPGIWSQRRNDICPRPFTTPV